MISVIIPMYNAEEHIKKCVESIINQTFRDVEIIVIDDGSTDSSKEKISDYITTGQIRYIYQENSGPAAARNKGVSEAKGEYLFFVDSDDYIEPDAFELMYKMMPETDMVYCGLQRDYDDGRNEKCPLPLINGKIYTPEQILEKLLLLQIRFYSCGILFKKSIWREADVNYSSQKYMEDWTVIAGYIVNCKKITYIDNPCYHYYQREASLTHTSNYTVVANYNRAVRDVLNILISEKKCDEEIITSFKILTMLETLHELYCINNKDLMIIKRSDEYNSWMIGSLRVISLKKISIKDKIKWIIWKSGLYSFFKRFVNI